MKLKLILALQLFIFLKLSATVQPSLAQVKSFSQKGSWAFEENKGQIKGADASMVKFKYRASSDLSVFVTNHSLIYQFERQHYPSLTDSMARVIKKGEDIEAMENYIKNTRIETYRMDIELVGANPQAEIVTDGKSTDYIQYYNYDALDVHSYQKIIYKDIYPKIDWVIYKNSQGIKYDFIVHPGGNPKLIQWRTEWVDDIKLSKEGDLVLKNILGTITENKPMSIQGDRTIASKFKLQSNIISFDIASYDSTKILIIDPSIGWVTYYGGYNPILGGANYCFFSSAVVDKTGNVYGAGMTKDYPNIAQGGHQNTYGGGSMDAMLVKFDNDGYRLWATFYGGSGGESGGVSCCVDDLNNVYIAGNTLSSSGIAYNGFQNSLIGYGGAFIVKFNPAGVRGWGTYFGTVGTAVQSMCYDPTGNVYITGASHNVTASTYNMTYNGHQTTFGGGYSDAFLAKFSTSGARIWATYYGDTGNDNSFTCSADANGSVYIAGNTTSAVNIAYNGHQNTIGGLGSSAPLFIGDGESYMVKFNKDGVRQWGTYYGDTCYADFALSCVVDKNNDVYLAGGTQSSRYIATIGSHSATNNGMPRFYLAKFNSSGTRLWGTYYGDYNGSSYYSSSSDYNINCTVDDSNFVYLFGTDVFIMGNLAYNAFQSSSAGYIDIFFAKFSSSGTRIWGSYFGGPGRESSGGWCNRFTLDKKGNIFFCGATDSISPSMKSSNLAYKGFQSAYSKAIFGKICHHLDSPSIAITVNRPNPICEGSGLSFTSTVGREGSYPIYEWKVNGQAVGSSTKNIYLTNLKNNDTVQCLLRSSATCLYFDTVWSGKYTVYVRSADTTNKYDTICGNKYYVFNNQLITTAGFYRDTLISSIGCDSFIFLHLYVKPYSSYSYNFTTSCTNPSYYFNNQTLNQSGIYKDTLTNIYGCDSFVTLNLKVVNPSSTSLSITRCPNQPYFFNGQNRTTSGTYTQILTNTQGCDSTITLNLNVLTNPASQSNTIWACTPFVFQGKTYMNNAVVKDTLKSSYGCDSLYLTYNILLKPISTTRPVIEHIVCDSVWIGGVKYTTNFSYIDTFRTTADISCDSLYQPVKYTIKYTPNLTISSKQADTFYKGETVNLYPSQVLNYLWKTGEKTRSKSFVINSDQTIYLIGWNDTECRDTAFIQLIALDPTILDFPTGFSPTGIYSDNHYFKPNTNGKVEKIRFDIYNRLGEKVYFSTQPNMTGWDGTYKGKDCPAGLYSYICEYTTNRRIYFKTGEVMLVR